MTIRKMEEADRASAQSMWIEIFEEDPAFAAYYFDNRFYPEHSFGAFEDGVLIAMALGRPTVIRAEGRDLPALLVAGVSTRPQYRGLGLMHRLMTLLIDQARQNGFVCCYLHPVSESLYRSLGFRNGTDIMKINSGSVHPNTSFRIEERTEFSDMLSIYRAAMRTHDGMQLRDLYEFRTVYADYATDDAKTLIAYEQNEPIGYLIIGKSGSVYELLAQKKDAYEALLSEAARRAEKPLHVLAPIDCGIEGERLYSMQYLVFDDAFRLPLKNGYCRLAY